MQYKKNGGTAIARCIHPDSVISFLCLNNNPLLDHSAVALAKAIEGYVEVLNIEGEVFLYLLTAVITPC